MTLEEFHQEILEGIPSVLPAKAEYDLNLNHAPKRKDVLRNDEKKLALKNALRYFPVELHAVLAPEFAEELKEYGRIYMLRYKPKHKMYARNIEDYPGKSLQA